MTGIYPAVMSDADRDALISALQSGCDTYLAWKRAAQKLRDVQERLREEYINKVEGRLVVEDRGETTLPKHYERDRPLTKMQKNQRD